MIIGFFGRQRSGKTTFLANYVRINDRKKKINSFLRSKLHLKKDLFKTYTKIYSTDYIRGCVSIRPKDVGAFIPERGSLFLLPDAGTYFNNRLSKSIPPYTVSFFSDSSHLGVDIIWDSQTVNVDKVLRDRSWFLYIVKKFDQISYTQLISFKIDVNKETKQIEDAYIKHFFLIQFLY